MESHPVPQNVTSFEFHLVGNMTLRQFGYLAVGLGIAWLSFALFFNNLPILAWPLIIVSASLGAAYAFLPIMERPLDYWTKAFVKAIRKPTLRKYSSKIIFPDDPKFKDRLQIYLHYIQSLPQNTLTQQPTAPSIGIKITPPAPEKPEEKKEEKQAATAQPTPPAASAPAAGKDAVSEFLENLNKLAQESDVKKPLPTAPVQTAPPPQPTPPPPPPAPSPTSVPEPSNEDLSKTVQLAKEAQSVQNRILEAEKRINDIKSGAATEGVDPRKYTQEFQSVLADLQKMNQKAREISHELAELSKTPNESTIASAPTTKPNIIPSLTLSSTPNIINGIVTDAQGNYIEGAIIVAHDKAGLPVRALKTNKLGQFIAATPLPSGTYTISVEKEDLAFDVVQVELNDKVLNPVVISAKRGGVPNA
jgi:hypothetical protein